jgi:hypothetical protein
LHFSVTLVALDKVFLKKRSDKQAQGMDRGWTASDLDRFCKVHFVSGNYTGIRSNGRKHRVLQLWVPEPSVW